MDFLTIISLETLGISTYLLQDGLKRKCEFLLFFSFHFGENILISFVLGLFDLCMQIAAQMILPIFRIRKIIVPNCSFRNPWRETSNFRPMRIIRH